MRKLISMREELSDGGPLALAAKRILLIAAVGETLTDVERATFKALTGRDAEPGVMVELLEALIGRRGGKSAPWRCCASISRRSATGRTTCRSVKEVWRCSWRLASDRH